MTFQFQVNEHSRNLNSAFTFFIADAVERHARQDFAAIIFAEDPFLKIFCRVIAAVVPTSAILQLTDNTREISISGNRYVIEDIKTSVECIRKLFEKSFRDKRDIIILPIQVGDGRVVIHEYSHSPIVLKKPQIDAAVKAYSAWFKDHISPALKDFTESLHARCIEVQVQQEITRESGTKTETIKGFSIRWNKTEPFVYTITPRMPQKRPSVTESLSALCPEQKLYDVTLLSNDDIEIQAHACILYMQADEELKSALASNHKKMKLMQTAGKELKESVDSLYLETKPQSLFTLYKKQLFCDFCLISSEGVEIKIHGLLLYLYGGQVFQTAMSSSMKESIERSIRFGHVSKSVLRHFVHFLYFGQNALLPENILKDVRYPIVSQLENRSLLRRIADVFYSVPPEIILQNEQEQRERQSKKKTEIEADMLGLIELGNQWQVPGLVDCCTNVLSVMQSPDRNRLAQLANLYENPHLADIVKNLENLKI